MATLLLSDPYTLTLTVGAVTLALAWWLATRRPSGLPPGPGPALPVVGHLHLMSSDPRLLFRQWRAQYGDVFSFYMGARLVVVLNGYDVIKEAFVKMADVFSHRPSLFLFSKIGKEKGVVSSYGPLWKEQRKIALEILRQFGMGKNVLAEKVQEEVDHYVRAVRDLGGTPADLQALTQVSVSNNICSIIFGERYEYDDEEFKTYIKLINENVKNLGNAGLINYMPLLEHVPGDPFRARSVLDNAAATYALLGRKIAAHRRDREGEGQEGGGLETDFIHAYLTQAEKMQGSGKPNTLDQINLLHVCNDLFGAGTETTATTIGWTILYLTRRQDVQEACYKEIRDVVGTGRAPRLADRQHTPYLEATIMEVMRRGNIVPLGVPHGLARDVELRGLRLPQDAVVLPNLDSVLMDAATWGDPEAFRPERFIRPDGGLLRPDEFAPFSLGRRVCLGESLARTELYLYLSSLIQHFRFVPPEGQGPPPDEGIQGITFSPKPFKVRAVPRE